MASVEQDLARLEAWWSDLGPDVRLVLAERWGGAVVLFGEGCAAAGTSLAAVKGPLFSLLWSAFQSHFAASARAALFKLPPPEGNEVMDAIERKFPALVTFLVTLTGALGGTAPAALAPVVDVSR